MKIISVEDAAFRPYGRVIATAPQHEPTFRLMAKLQTCPITDGVVYTASEPGLEALPEAEWLSRELFGGMPVQLGWCNGHNRMMDAMEYHKSSEINLAGRDMVLFLGQLKDVEDDFTYDTSKAQAFFVKEGALIEIYGTTLHYAPCDTGSRGFQSLVALPRDTNTPLQAPVSGEGEARLITARNKWLIGHPEAALDGNAFRGLKGENLRLTM